MRDKPIPEPTEELKSKCDVENQFSNFSRVLRAVVAVPKEQVLKLEAKEKHRNARKRAKKKRDS